ncbi:GntR family transcriptional regulator [Alloprevotella tannerae]|uniref:GntR family transcriptional regulator n=1 Tax=Alloprevotella tannerae TaxID=76122 RepID=UPI00288C4C52|nr:GntR family transcriptional regulator [Alloprevotella tannerae]
MIFKSGLPIYLQIARRLTDEILAGKYGVDGRVPSVREYSAIVEVNVNTTVKAYDWLAQNGYIYNKRGLGYFVAKNAPALILELRRKEFREEYLPDLARQMKALNLTFDDLKEAFSSLSLD